MPLHSQLDFDMSSPAGLIATYERQSPVSEQVCTQSIDLPPERTERALRSGFRPRPVAERIRPNMHSDHSTWRPAMAVSPARCVSRLGSGTCAPRSSIARSWQIQDLFAHANPVLCCLFPEQPADLIPENSPPSHPLNSQNAMAALCRSPIAASLMNGFLCISLWLSLALALWMARGWLGLLFSGQVLSAGTCLVKGLAKKTRHACSLNNDAANQPQGVQHVP